MLDYSRLEELRQSKGITQKHIAQQLGRKPSIFQAWRDKKSEPSDEQLIIVAKILDTSIEYLRGLSDSKNPATESGDGNKVSSISDEHAYVNSIFDRLTFEYKIRAVNELQSLLRQQLAQDGQKESD